MNNARQSQLARSRRYKDEIMDKLKTLDDTNLGVMFGGLFAAEELPRISRILPSKKTLLERAEKILSSDTLPLPADFHTEAIIKLIARPVFLVRNGKPELTGMEVDKWKGRVESALNSLGLEDSIAAVGRIEGENHPEFDWFGTGWLLADDLIVTNRHVAGLFSMRNESDLTFRKYNDLQVYPRIDFLSEHGNNGTAKQYEFIKPVYMATSNEPDVAIFQVKWVGDRPCKPLELCPSEAKIEEDIAIIGYPAMDSRSRLGKDMQRIFNNIYDVKRFAPGEISSLSSANNLGTHDATTLGGNSGSPVLSLENGKVLGIHFAGQEQKNNFFVPASVLRKLKDQQAKNFTGVTITPAAPPIGIPVDNKLPTDIKPIPPTAMKKRAEFLITAINDPDTIDQIESVLSAKYDEAISLELAMPGNATDEASELFAFSASVEGNVHEEADRLRSIPGVEFAEADIKLMINTSHTFIRPDPDVTTESFVMSDGFGKWNEESMFVVKYSNFVKGKTPEQYRKWNWEKTGFDKIDFTTIPSPHKQGIRVVQFDTGYSKHSKVFEGFNLDDDYNFLEKPDDAFDPQAPGFVRHPGHGTRTGSLLVGKPFTTIRNNGNAGLLSAYEDFKLVPYRVAQSVILINRQRDLADALDKAISQGFDVITMSMGLPPTIATAHMAKKAYEKGVIWCCAAGNEVQAVIAPAVFPGTIAVAASNPNDGDWYASSRGDTVDVTAPGEDVYVPIRDEDDQQEDFSYGDGTSYATPHVAAAAALWLSLYKEELQEYKGWERVEAFRQALYKSSRKSDNLPTKGFGKGILDVVKLLATHPTKEGLVSAYNGWNEHAFLANLQGYGQLIKTYWNRAHGWIFGVPKGDQESVSEEPGLSPEGALLERTLFATSVEESVSNDAYGEMMEETELIERFRKLQGLASAKLPKPIERFNEQLERMKQEEERTKQEKKHTQPKESFGKDKKKITNNL